MAFREREQDNGDLGEDLIGGDLGGGVGGGRERDGRTPIIWLDSLARPPRRGGGESRGGYPLHPLARVAKVWMSVEDWGGGVLTGGGRGVSPGHIETNYQKCRRNCYFARSFRHPLKMVE